MRIFKLLAILFVMLATVGCSKVPVGHVGIKVYLLGSDKGVDHEVLGTGRYYISINQELHKFPTFLQNVVWTADSREGSPHDESFTFQSSEGLGITGNFSMAYKLDPEKIPALFQEHRAGINQITNVYVRNTVRAALNSRASARTVEEIYGSGKVSFMAEVVADIKAELEPKGFIIDQFAPIGRFVLPPTVVTALNKKIEATQRAEMRENEVREAEAEAAKRLVMSAGRAEAITIEAEAQAEANRILSRSITGELVAYKTIEKWNGVLPTMTGGQIPMVQLPQ